MRICRGGRKGVAAEDWCREIPFFTRPARAQLIPAGEAVEGWYVNPSPRPSRQVMSGGLSLTLREPHHLEYRLIFSDNCFARQDKCQAVCPKLMVHISMI